MNINSNSLYGKYIRNQIEPKELSQKDFNTFMLEWYADYQSRNGTKTFIEFMKDAELTL